MTGKPRGTYAVGRARRELILDVAMANFAQQGYARTSMSKIAQDVGLTQPGLMHHFRTKQHLLVALAERRFEQTRAWVMSAAPDTDGTGPFRTLLESTERFLQQPGLIELFVIVSGEAADPSSPAHELYTRRYQLAVTELTELFRRSVEAGFLREDVDYEHVARDCIAVNDGMQLQWVLAGGRLDLVARIKENLERIAAPVQRVPRPIDLSAPVPAAL